MIWAAAEMDPAFQLAFVDTGSIDEQVVQRHLAHKKRHHPVTRQGIARY